MWPFLTGYRSGQCELRDLWIVIAISVSLSLYHLSFSLVDTLRNIVLVHPEFLSEVIFLWLILLMEIAYRRWQEAVRRQKELRDIMTSISTEVIMVVDPERNILLCNDAPKLIFGYETDDLLHCKTDMLYLDRREDKTKHGEIREHVEKIGVHIGKATGLRKNGEQFPLEIVTALMKGRKGAVLLMRDITEREQAEQTIIKAKADAEEAYKKLKETERLRDNLTHMIIHDLRAPLQAIMTNMELLKNYGGKRFSDKDKKWVENSLDQTGVLAMMINSVLDVSRLESGAMPLSKKACDLMELSEEAAGTLLPMMDKTSLSCEVSGVNVATDCDEDLIRRVILNLLSNAVRFTPAGGFIRIAVTTEDNFASVSVSDNGPNIPEEYHRRIFEKFGQADATHQKKMHSTGLGLTFCKLAVEAHGGIITVENNPDTGVTFRFRLPMTAAGKREAT